MTFVKFCGMTREADLDLACELGVSAVGFVLWSASPRAISLEMTASLIRRLPGEVLPVGVFVNPSAEEVARSLQAGVRVVQLHGMQAGLAQRTAGANGRVAANVPFSDCGAAVWVAASLEGALPALGADGILLLDAHDPQRHGGTGRTIDWQRAAGIARKHRIVLAGGLTADNVSEAIRRVRPYGVDVASGIEERPGIKSAPAMKAFMAAVREADQ